MKRFHYVEMINWFVADIIPPLWLAPGNWCIHHNHFIFRKMYIETQEISQEGLKGQCHKIFCFRFFSWITFPQAPGNNFRVISNFFENSLRYSQVKVHHWCQGHRWQNCRRYQRHRRQICHQYQRHQRQILPLVPLVLLTPVANLPPVSMIPVANLPLVSTTPGGKLPPVSLTPVANNGDNIRLQTP